MSYAEKFEQLQNSQRRSFVCKEIGGITYVDYGIGHLVPLSETLKRLPALQVTPQDWQEVLEVVLVGDDIPRVGLYAEDILTAKFVCMLAGFEPPSEKEFSEFLAAYYRKRLEQERKTSNSEGVNCSELPDHEHCEMCYQCITCNNCTCSI